EDLARVQRTIISPSFYVLDVSPEIQSVPCKADGTLFDNTATVEIVAKLYFGIDDTDKGVNRSAALEDGMIVGTWDDNILTLPVSLLTSNTLRVFITVSDSENRTRTAIATVNKLYAGDTPFVYIMRLSENAVRVSEDKEIIPAKIAAQKLIKSGADYIDTDYGNITVSIDGGKDQPVKTGDVFVYIETDNGLLGDDAGRFILFDDADYAANGVKIPYGAKQLIFRYRTPENVLIQSETVPVLYDGAKGDKGQRGSSYWGTKKPDEAVYGDYYLDVNDGYIYEYSATYNAWIKITDYSDFRYKQAMNDMLSVAEHAPNIQFLAVVNAWVKNLVAGTALINELFAKNIIAQNKIASSNYYDKQGNPTGSGFLIDAQAGDADFRGNTHIGGNTIIDGNTLLKDVQISGNSIFEGAINSGPLYLSKEHTNALTVRLTKGMTYYQVRAAFIAAGFAFNNGYALNKILSNYDNIHIGYFRWMDYDGDFLRIWVADAYGLKEKDVAVVTRYTDQPDKYYLKNNFYLTQEDYNSYTFLLRNLPTLKPTTRNAIWNDNGTLKIVT
ncbi:hypothetical protein, partial [Treponema sp. Marseille-Q4130]|uniref:hypothetical protein n=1 Tax=Treponema sp. Marseille-Q4130 TaxID=2766702 RepID=UPI001994F924